MINYLYEKSKKNSVALSSAIILRPFPLSQRTAIKWQRTLFRYLLRALPLLLQSIPPRIVPVGLWPRVRHLWLSAIAMRYQTFVVFSLHSDRWSNLPRTLGWARRWSGNVKGLRLRLPFCLQRTLSVRLEPGILPESIIGLHLRVLSTSFEPRSPLFQSRGETLGGVLHRTTW